MKKIVPEKAPLKNNLKHLRTKLGFSLADVAEKTGYSPQFIHKIETGIRRLNTDSLVRISKGLGCSQSDLLSEHEASAQVPLVGYVGAGAKLSCQNFSGEPLDWIDSKDLGFNSMPAGYALAQVQGDSMLPVASPGDYLLVDTEKMKHGPDIDVLLGKRVIAIAEDGTAYFKILRRGSISGHYLLLSFNSPDIMEDVKLNCAIHVKAVYNREDI